MDGSFDPQSNNDSIERNVEVPSIVQSQLSSTTENNEINGTTESNSTYQTAAYSYDEFSPDENVISKSETKEPFFQVLYYKDTDDETKETFEDAEYKQVKNEPNPSKVLLPSSSYEESAIGKRSPMIIDERSLQKLERIARGANGEVFKYSYSHSYSKESDSELVTRSELVAIKHEFGRKCDKSEKIVKEYTKLLDLDHVNIIKLLGIVEKKDSNDLIVMELGECSLRMFLNDYELHVPYRIPFRICILYFLQIARGMKEAHAKVRARIYLA